MKMPKILVTKPFLPPLKEYVKYLKEIWNSGSVTNNGPLVQKLENILKDYLEVKHAFFVSNGTIALQIAIKALGLTKSIITTPFSFVATTNAIIWEHCTPIFADIEPATLCINPEMIGKMITKDTEAILAVHVYGIPCDVEKIDFLAKKYNLKVIYDSAHAFGSKIGGVSVFNYGDIATLSLHATKLFHSGEGGLVVTNNDYLAKKIVLLRNFGLDNGMHSSLGINTKNSEIHAALGLANFPHCDEIIHKRKKIVKIYDSMLEGVTLQKPFIPLNATRNFTYYPLIFNSEEELLRVVLALEKENIFPRRYFYPSLNTLKFVKGQSCPVSESIAKRILCLPLYHGLPISAARKTAAIILSNQFASNKNITFQAKATHL